jgi:hypothetical protein
MVSNFHLACLFIIFTRIYSHPIDYTRFFSVTTKADRSWSLLGWAWGAESTVSVVDRSPPVSFASRPAAFGAELTDPLLGYVIPVSSFTIPCDNISEVANVPPNLGCPKLCISGPKQPERTETWIALVQRGQCQVSLTSGNICIFVSSPITRFQFVDKVREAQRLGAKAVVVGGDDPSVSGNPDMLVNMYSPSKGYFLPTTA